ncbi:MAG: hypothetical protein WA555_01185 [Candidatus Sulfotelmatobacter sp.]
MKIPPGQLLPAAAALVWLVGCASMGPPLPPSLELPRPPSNLRATRKGDKVTLTWTIPSRTTDRQSVRYLGKTEICRVVDAALKQCATPVGEAPQPANFTGGKKAPARKLTATFTDTLPLALEQEHPTGFVTYAVEVLNTANRGAGISNQAHAPLVPTISPFRAFNAQVTARGVLISWQCPPISARSRTGTKYLFRIFRRLESSASETKIAEIDATDCALGLSELAASPGQPSNPTTSGPKEQGKTVTSFLDQTFDWEDTYVYRATVVSVVETAGRPAVEVEGEDTPEVKVFAHDVFPPAVPAGLQAVFSGPGQPPFIDLIWTPVTDADLEGYNIYRHQEGAAPVKLNSEPVKTPAFRDTQVAAGNTYFYSVSAVDLRGNESTRSKEASERVP